MEVINYCLCMCMCMWYRLTSAVAEHRRSVRPSRRTQGSRNPLRALAAREDIRQDYMGERVNTAAEERIQAEKSELIFFFLNSPPFYFIFHFVAQSSHLAFVLSTESKNSSAAASYPARSKEVISSSDVATTAHPPFSSLMLIHIKGQKTLGLLCLCVSMMILRYLYKLLLVLTGRQRVQVRLVEPSVRSLNSGDCFLLVTPERCILWSGEFANEQEKTKVPARAVTWCNFLF